jgi:predicted transcriptional regulator
MKKWESVKADLMKDPSFPAEVQKLQPEYEIIKEIVKARIEQNITQEELAERAGTKQSNISRLERGNANPSLSFLKKVARGLGKELVVTFK